MMPWFPTRLTPAQLEERRLRAADLLARGTRSQAAIARLLHVSRATVCRWAAILHHDGRQGLRRRPHTGRPPRLTPRQWQRLTAVLLRGAQAAGFDTERWTLPRIAAVIRRTFGVRYHPRSLGPALRARMASPRSGPSPGRANATTPWSRPG